MTTRRDFFKLSGAVAAATVTPAALAGLPEIVSMDTPDTQPPLMPPNGRPYNPVVTLNGWTLPWRMKDGVKEFHLVAEPVVREIAPGDEGPPVGLQRAVARTDHRSGGRRPGADFRHQPPARAHHHPLARPAPAEWHGWRRRSQSARHQAGQDLRLRVCRASPRHLHVSPACRRDDADGDGHDGILGDASQGQASADRNG